MLWRLGKQSNSRHDSNPQSQNILAPASEEFTLQYLLHQKYKGDTWKAKYDPHIFSFFFRIDPLASALLQHFQHGLPDGAGHVASPLPATFLQGQEAHRVNQSSVSSMASASLKGFIQPNQQNLQQQFLIHWGLDKITRHFTKNISIG